MELINISSHYAPPTLPFLDQASLSSSLRGIALGGDFLYKKIKKDLQMKKLKSQQCNLKVRKAIIGKKLLIQNFSRDEAATM